MAAAAALLPLLGVVALPSGSPAVATLSDAVDAGPISQQVVATEDTYLAPWAPSVTGGGVDPSVLVAGDEQLDGRVSYLKFPAPTLPSNATDVSATLVLHQLGTAPGSITVYRIVDPWEVSTLTPADAPGLAGPLGYADVTGGGDPVSVALPTSKVPWGGMASFGVTAGTGGALSLSFASTGQPDQALWPELSISYTLESGVPCTVSTELVPSCGAWFGSTVNPLGAEAGPLDAVARQESELGRPLDIVHVYHSGVDDWPTPDELALTSDPSHPRLLMVNWKPENGSSWADVAAGAQDPWIDTVAARIVARLGSTRFFLTLHHEPEQEVQADGSGYSESDYVAMFRHVVLRLRADGVTGAVMVWNMMGFAGWGDAGYYDALYPGDDVVDWIGYDPYSHHAAPLSVFADRAGRMFPGFYTWATTAHPDKPLMLGEFGVDSALPSDRVSVFESFAAQARAMPAIKAYLYFDHVSDATTNGNDWAYDDDPSVLAAAKDAFDDPYFRQQ
jgi:hypothetical protein